MICDQFVGASGVVENAYTGANSGNPSNVTVTSVVDSNAGDLEYFAGIAQGYNTTTGLLVQDGTVSFSVGNTVENDVSTFTAGGRGYIVNAATVASHTDTMTMTSRGSPNYNVAGGVVVIFEAAPAITFADSLTVSDSVAFNVQHTLTDIGLKAWSDSIVTHRMPGGPRTYTEVITQTDLGIVKVPSRKLTESVTITETFSKVHMPHGPQTFSEVIPLADLGFSWHGTFHPTFSEVLSLTEPSFSTVNDHIANFADTFTLTELFGTLQQHFTSLADTLSLLDVSSLTHDQQQIFAEVFSTVDSFSEFHTQMLEVAEAFTVSDVFAEVHEERLTLADVITLVESFVEVYTPGGPTPILATGSLTGSSAAAAVIAAAIFAIARGRGTITGIAGIAYQIAGRLRGWTVVNGNAGEHLTDTGAAAGHSAASATEGAHLVLATGSTAGVSGETSDTEAHYALFSEEVDGVSPEMDADTQCLFEAQASTFDPDFGSTASATATMTSMNATGICRGRGSARATPFSPITATGEADGHSFADYVPLIFLEGLLYGYSATLAAPGCRFNVQGASRPIQTSRIAGMGNYGPGALAGVAAGAGAVAGVATVFSHTPPPV